MLNQVKLLKSKLKKPIFANFLSLGFLQVSNFLLPLLIFPYLIRVIGVENFGFVSFSQALMNYFVIFTDYGFNLSATRDISINRSNKQELGRLFSSVILTKMLLAVVAFAIVLFLVSLIPAFKPHKDLYLLSFMLVLGQIFFPVWFFQGIEEMKFITYLNVFSKGVFVVSIFLLVTLSHHYIYINFILGSSNLLASLISLMVIYKKYGISVKRVSINAIKEQISGGKQYFLSNFSVNLYINSNVFILGLFASPQIIGYYSIVEKIILAVRQLLSVFSQVIFPHLCQLSLISFSSVKSFIKKTVMPFGVLILAISAAVFIFSDSIIFLLTKEGLPEVIFLLKLLSVVPVIVFLNIPAYQILLINNFKNSYSSVLFIGSILNIILNLILASQFNAIGTAISVITTEIFITLALYWVLESKHPCFSIFKVEKIRQ